MFGALQAVQEWCSVLWRGYLFIHFAWYSIFGQHLTTALSGSWGSDSALCFVANFTHAVLFPQVFCDYFWCIFDFALLETLFLGIF